MIINKTIRKNELTVKQLENIPADRNVYVPLGRAYIYVISYSFLKRNKDETIKELASAN